MILKTSHCINKQQVIIRDKLHSDNIRKWFLPPESKIPIDNLTPSLGKTNKFEITQAKYHGIWNK